MAGSGGVRTGAGRPKGRRNKATADIKALAQEHGAVAVQKLVDLMLGGESQQVQLGAAKELLDRGYGKAVQATTVTGADGGPIEQSIRVVFGND